MTFEELCSIYPRVERRKVAEAAFRHALTKTDYRTIYWAVVEQRKWLLKDGPQFCPDLAAWLHEERWRAKIPTTPREADEFGYYPGQFDNRPLGPEEEELQREHDEWVRRYIESLEDG